MKIIKKNKYSILASILKYGFVFVVGFSLVLSMHGVNAADSTPTGPGPQTPTGPGTQTPTGPGSQINVKIANPLGGVDSIPTFILLLLNFALIIGVPIVTLAIIYCGFLFVAARGNSEKLTEAKKALLYTVIGAALLLGSVVIANAIKGTVDQLKS